MSSTTKIVARDIHRRQQAMQHVMLVHTVQTNGPGSHTYCSIVVYYQAKISEMKFVIVTRRHDHDVTA